MAKDNLKEFLQLLDDLKPGEKIPDKYFELNKWLSGVKHSTRLKYVDAMRKYQIFTGLTAKQLIDEAEEDQNKPRRKRGSVEDKIKKFYTFLTESWEKIDRSGRKTGDIGLGAYKSSILVGNIKAFYSSNGFVYKWSPPKSAPKKENQRIELSPKDVKKMINACKNNRDKSLIISGYQGGFDANTVSLLDIGDLPLRLIDTIQKHEGDIGSVLREINPPWVLHIVREKEGIDFHTCLGVDASEYLVIYLWERMREGYDLSPEKPVYSIGDYNGNQDNPERRITPNIIQKVMRKIVVKAGIISEAFLKRSDINPAGYHALRGSFSKRLDFAGMQTSYIDYMQGHALAYGGAYRKPNPKKLRERYKECEAALSISEGFKGLADIEEQLKEELELRDHMIRGMKEEILDLKQGFKVFNEVFKEMAEIPELKETLAKHFK